MRDVGEKFRDVVIEILLKSLIGNTILNSTVREEMSRGPQRVPGTVDSDELHTDCEMLTPFIHAYYKAYFYKSDIARNYQ